MSNTLANKGYTASMTFDVHDKIIVSRVLDVADIISFHSEFRQLITTLNYVVSTHAAEELEDDNLSILDLENIILTGQIVERQRDTQTREVKCVVAGITLDAATAEAVVKVGFTGKLVVITAYLC